MNFETSRTAEILEAAIARNGDNLPKQNDLDYKHPFSPEMRATICHTFRMSLAMLFQCPANDPSRVGLVHDLKEQYTLLIATLDPALLLKERKTYESTQTAFFADMKDLAKK